MPGDERLILALNCGSSSLKYGVYRAEGNHPQLVFEGEAEEITDHSVALNQALELLERQGLKQFWKAGHRVVHGGPNVREHQVLTPDVFKKLQAAVPFAPLHLPASIAVIEAVRKKMPDLPQVICLDTAFHRTMPDVARTFALPAAVRQLGVERYGFHGLSIGIYFGSVATRAGEPCHSAFRQRRQHHRDSRWPVDRHHDGIDTHGRSDDGHALRGS